MDLLLASPLHVLLVLIAALLGSLVLGRRLGVRDATSGAERSEVGAIDGAVFALLGLLIAITFSGAAERFDRRRTLIVERGRGDRRGLPPPDMLPPATQPVAAREISPVRGRTPRRLPGDSGHGRTSVRPCGRGRTRLQDEHLEPRSAHASGARQDGGRRSGGPPGDSASGDRRHPHPDRWPAPDPSSRALIYAQAARRWPWWLGHAGRRRDVRWRPAARRLHPLRAFALGLSRARSDRVIFDQSNIRDFRAHRRSPRTASRSTSARRCG